jgi:hypothetical protein
VLFRSPMLGRVAILLLGLFVLLSLRVATWGRFKLPAGLDIEFPGIIVLFLLWLAMAIYNNYWRH